MSPIMAEAIDKEDWERMDKGLPPLPKKKIVIPEPEKPEIKNQIKFDDIPLESFVNLEYANRKNIKNENGVTFIGFEVKIILSPNAQTKRGRGRPKESEKQEISEESKILLGWMIEGDFTKFYWAVRDKIDVNIIRW